MILIGYLLGFSVFLFYGLDFVLTRFYHWRLSEYAQSGWILGLENSRSNVWVYILALFFCIAFALFLDRYYLRKRQFFREKLWVFLGLGVVIMSVPFSMSSWDDRVLVEKATGVVVVKGTWDCQTECVFPPSQVARVVKHYSSRGRGSRRCVFRSMSVEFKNGKQISHVWFDETPQNIRAVYATIKEKILFEVEERCNGVEKTGLSF